MQRDTAFQMAASNIRFGRGVTREIGMDLVNLGATKTMLVVDPALVGSPVGERVISSLNENGVGHYRVYLDDASGEDFLVTSGDATVKVKLPSDVTDGSHELRVVLHENDRTPLDPPAETGVLLIVYRLD